VTGTARYNTEDVVAATGLHIGKPLTDSDLSNAILYLEQCGAFGEVVYTRREVPSGVELDLKVQDGEHFIPAFFDNIVWFSDEELIQQLHLRVPLFRGELPVVGTLAQQVADALAAFLSEQRLPHHVSQERLEFGPSDIDQWTQAYLSPDVVGVLGAYIRVVAPATMQRRPVEVINFFVDTKIRMRKIGIRESKEPELSELREVSGDLVTRTYSRRTLRTFVEQVLMPVYLRHGYLEARFDEPEIRPVQKAAEENTVDLVLSIEPGRQYKWEGIKWFGVTAFPLEALDQFIHLRHGQVADFIELRIGLDGIVSELYHRRGNVGVTVDAVPRIIEQAATVSYEVHINEGPQYHVGKVEIDGLNEHDTERVKQRLNMHTGDVYNAIHFNLSSEVDYWSFGWKQTFEQKRNDDDKTVDITIRFQS
jgi:hypothetical protein